MNKHLKHSLYFFCISILLSFASCNKKSDHLLNKSESIWLEQNKDKIEFLFGYDTPPLGFHKDGNEYVGTMVDFSNEIERILNQPFKRKHFETWDQLIEYSKKSNHFIIVGIARTPNRTKYLGFTNSILNMPYVIYTRKNSPYKDINSFNKKHLISVKNYAVNDYLKKYYPEIKIIEVKDELEGLQKLSTGEYEAMITNHTYSSHIITEQEINNLEILCESGFTNRLKVAASINDPVLLNIIRKAVDEIDPNTKKEIYHEWALDKPDTLSYPATISFIAFLVLAIFTSVFLYFAVTRLRKNLKQKSSELIESEAKFRSITENSNDAIYLIQNEKFVYINKKFSSIFGFSNKEILDPNFNFSHLISSKNSPEDIEILYKETIKTTPNKFYSFSGLHKSGKEIYAEVSISQAIYKDKTAVLGILRDISAQKKAEQDLLIAKEKAEENDRLKSAFLANISHEIRTPMNGILGFTQLLSDEEYSNEEKQSFIQIIERSGQRMLSTINDIINISKIESEQINVHYSSVDIKELMSHQYQFFLPECQKKGLEISLNNSFSEKTTEILSDYEKLSAIITNIIKNAIKYTDHGFIEFGCKEEENDLVFIVRDSGIGIPENRQEAIFERFIQADIHDRESREGSGLGLAITKAYTEMLGGSISVESEINKGSTFTVKIPKQTEF